MEVKMLLELKDICFNVRQDSKEKEILKNKFLFERKSSLIDSDGMLLS